MSTTEVEDLNILEFPCLIEVKIFLLNTVEDEQAVKQLVADCIEHVYFESWTCKESKGGKYRSASAAIRAQNRAQMDVLYQALSDSDKVIMVI
ncbi:MAG: putative lipoic acid-binding regulatory protein [Saprospiraceae bacterium]|jgi:putative lipoic acid-binding regulatory protein